MSDDPVIDSPARPGNIVETNQVPIILAVVLVVILVLFLLFRSEPKVKTEKRADERISQVVRDEKSAGAHWFNDDAHKKIMINPGEAINSPEARQRTEKTLLDEQERKYRQGLIEMEYAKKRALAELQNKRDLEERAMEYAAMNAPIDTVKGALPVPQGRSSSVTGQVISKEPVRRGSIPEMPGGRTAVPSAESLQDAKEAFLNRSNDVEQYLPSTKVPLRSPYEIKAGTYIPAALVTGIQSDLPGPVVAQVTANVYDTFSGQYLLIPQGAKLIGEYDSHVSFGQNRALVVWTRMIFPDGASLDLGRMQGVDMAGYAGFYDKVDNHYLRIYANAMMLSLVGAGYDLLNKSPSSQGDASAGDTVAANVGQRLADVSSQTMERNLSIQPTIVIRPGYAFNIMVVKDVILEALADDAP